MNSNVLAAASWNISAVHDLTHAGHRTNILGHLHMNDEGLLEARVISLKPFELLAQVAECFLPV